MLSESLFTPRNSSIVLSVSRMCRYACAYGYFKSTCDPRGYLGMHGFIYSRSYMLTLCRLNLLVPATVVDHKKEKVSWRGSVCLILNDQHPALPCKSSLGGLSCSQRCWGEYDIIACMPHECVCAHRPMLWSRNHQ